MKLDSFQEVVLESSGVEELKEKVKSTNHASFSWFLNVLFMSSVGKHGNIMTLVLFFLLRPELFNRQACVPY